MPNLKNLLEEEVDLLPLCLHYAELLQKATEKFSISMEEARKRYGVYTYKEWNALLNS